MSKWHAFKEGIQDEFKSPFKHLNPPACDEEIQSIAQRIGCNMPKEFIELYKDCNGENDEGLGIGFGLRLLSIQEIHSEMDSWDEIIADGMEDFNDECKSTPRNAIQLAYANHKWVPVFSDGAGNFLGMDFDPGPKGKAGQIINFGRDEEAKRVISKTLGSLFTLMLGLSKKDYAGLNDNGSFHVAEMHFIDAVKSANKLDLIVAKRSPDYGCFSVWMCPNSLSSLPDNYFDSNVQDEINFYKDFNVSTEDAVSVSRSMMQDGCVGDIEERLKFEMYIDKYKEKLLEACNKANISQTSVVLMIKDYNYELRQNNIRERNGVLFLGAYKVY
ncbi:SMI1/KNR4 family protein [Aliikangiella sp. G2MR2-5]|uniref:SMI1/KNR4 family protein n=1 Tax=Aliikangiella sp. G2MR2-5 TaxID=2788943 RepID=UPI0018AA55F8|nr:SMI1/KNR4 family protein [Aliikangiella sp. G2MR2-5]